MSSLIPSTIPPTFALVVGERSGDILGADLIRGLKQVFPDAKFVGIGGPLMHAEGMESWFEMERLSVMGFFEVLKHLPYLLKLRKQLIKNVLDLKPDVFIGIDAPDFNFYVERRLKQSGIKTVHYVGPSVWAWRQNRLIKIKQAVDGMLVLFPFEPEIYQQYKIPVTFVGHPLANQVPEVPDKVRARHGFGLSPETPLTGLLPGSRMSEVDRMADIYVRTAQLLQKSNPQMEFIVPCVHERAKDRIMQAIKHYGNGVTFHLVDQQATEVMEASDQLLVTSGTATLQAALMLRPMVISIKVHPLSYWIMKRMALIPWIGLPNILAKCSVVEELIQEQATPEGLSQALERLVDQPAERQKQIQTFIEQKKALTQPSAELAVEALIKWAGLQRSVLVSNAAD
ncbi:lipid-A-disaccharide synthase [Thiomicrospira sp. R3]|uniref:lipid-A-disaccharide synthase n=1 Tax=Thiomicrospira sp. R3 TaxID=3035472 RepID=UPI00259B66F1|nr:lipid-A-disaccharide synthase [Thiomicrospira sp. R3]WFE68352.1 lipid-A-disaccharide synthase [Thiomicrospira sp. R3]